MCTFEEAVNEETVTKVHSSPPPGNKNSQNSKKNILRFNLNRERVK